jgi:hypothetical protein
MTINFSDKDVAKFKSKYKEMASGCWEWQGNRQKPGIRNQLPYGIFHAQGTQIGAHRASYLINIGPIVNGLHVLHSCDNPGCVNPSHLRLGTPKENTQDRIARNRNGSRTKLESRQFLTPPKVEIIRVLIGLGYSDYDIGLFMNCRVFAVTGVRTGVTFTKYPKWSTLRSKYGFRMIPTGIFDDSE